MNFEFIDEGKSVSINAGGVVHTLPKNNYTIKTTDTINQNKILYIGSSSTGDALYTIDLNVDTVTGVGAGSTTADQLKAALLPIFFLDENSGGGGESSLIISATPPSDTSKLWYNTSEKIIYFYDGSDWLSEQLFGVVFNEQGTTPNNTFFRVGNTVVNDLGNGYHIGFDVKIENISFNRAPNTAQAGNFWLYSNEQTGTNNAAVICTFSVGTEGRGVLTPNVPTTISDGKYISMRWNGNQTNNNIIELRFRKKYS